MYQEESESELEFEQEEQEESESEVIEKKPKIKKVSSKKKRGHVVIFMTILIKNAERNKR